VTTPAEAPVRVVVADDQALVREGFKLILEHGEGIEVVGEAGDGRRAVAMTQRLRPDVVLMDIRMPVLNGIEATFEIVDTLGDEGPRVVVLTTFEQDDYIADALRAGASGFLLKDIEPDELREAVHTVAQGGSLLSPSVTRRVIAQFAQQRDRRPKQPERLERLTDREREVVQLVAKGLSNDEIGRELFMSPATAKTHVSRAMGKLHARDRAQLVVVAFETGLADYDQ
jgi:DNA-binding NarL/FixJ family response regulator